MTVTSTAPGPIGTIAGIPLYRNGIAPAHLASKTALRDRRLKPAPGQTPAAYIRLRYYKTLAALYDPAQAVPMPPRRIGDAWAYRAAHTCPRCGTVQGYVIDGDRCGDCRRRDQAKVDALRRRTCRACQAVRPRRLERGLCAPCLRAARKRDAAQRAARVERAQWCSGRERYGCTVRHASKRQVERHLAAGNSYFPRRFCPACERRREAEMAAHRAEQVAREQAEREARRREVAGLAAWAAGVLADPDAVILDTETTGLHEGARIVDIAVTTVRGQVLLDALVNPGEPIPAESTDVHGITDAMVAGAPSFAEILPDLARAIAGRRVLIYNREFDVERLRHELGLLGVDSGGWLAAVRTEDAMIPYSDWVGDWSEYWGNYRWQPLNGGHRALGDCRAVVECLKAMAGSAVEAAA